MITETNVPNRENLSYFGNANEAHGIYNFSLPLCCFTRWLPVQPPIELDDDDASAQDGTIYFNFIASHDGIGLRPVEGLLEQSEVDELLATMEQFGGRISAGDNDGTAKPYEINIALIEALQGTTAGSDEWWLERFTCAHAIMLAWRVSPLYIHCCWHA